MNSGALIAVSLVLCGWSILSDRLARWNLTGPLVFLIAGLLLANPRWGVTGIEVESATVHTLAELTLALLLFVDASSVPLAAARRELPLTARLLAIGLPLSVIGGTVVAVLVFPNLPLALSGLIAAALAPTDAALSASIIADERLPIDLRQTLNVESGLNDGIATPVVTFCLASAAGVLGITGHHDEASWGALGELGIGVVVGAATASVGGRALELAHRKGWMQHGSRRLGTLAVALLCFLVASEVGGNPFVAAFVGGLAFGAVTRHDTPESVELAELGGSLLSLVVWFVFGAGFVIPALEHVDVRIVLYAICSLTVVRMVPVAIALVGSGAARPTVAFIGWFGPRGLASVVFALLAVEELGITDPRVRVAVDTMAVGVLLSVVVHGVTARPLATRYLATMGDRPPAARGRS